MRSLVNQTFQTDVGTILVNMYASAILVNLKLLLWVLIVWSFSVGRLSEKFIEVKLLFFGERQGAKEMEMGIGEFLNFLMNFCIFKLFISLCAFLLISGCI